jgi:hypothetical protein
MKKALIYVVLVVMVSSVVTSCGISNKLKSKNCGCNMNKGYVGY